MRTRRFCAALLVGALFAGCQGGSTGHLTPSAAPAGKVTRKPKTVVKTECAPAPGQVAGTITEYSIPTASTHPYGVVLDASQNVWFTEFGNSALGELTASRSWNQYSTPTHSSEPVSVTIGSDGNPWFVEFATGKVGKFNTATDAITEYGFAGGSGSYPEVIDNSTVASTTGLWTTLNGNTEIANITTGGAISYAATQDRPYGISIDTAGDIWYTMYNPNKVAVQRVGHTSTVWNVPTSGSQPFAITEGPPGTGMWFTEYNGSKIGNISTSGVLTEHTIPTSASGPEGIIAACGNLWFAENSANKIGELNPNTGSFSEYPVPTASSGPRGVAIDGNGNVWFSESNSNKIAEITTVGGASPAPDGSIYLFNIIGGNIVNYGPGVLAPPPTATITSVPGASSDTNGGMAFDSSGNLWVTDGAYVAEYPPNANGSTAPLKTFTPADTGVRSIAVDAEGEILLTNPAVAAISAYSASSTGNATPIRTISGASTGLTQPGRIIVDGSDNIWVTNGLGIESFPASANGNVAPSLSLDSSWAANNGISQLFSLAITHSGSLMVLANGGENVFTFSPGFGESSHYSSEFNTEELNDIAVDDEGYLYGSSEGPEYGAFIYAPGSVGNPATPYAVISGSNDGLAEPGAIAVWSNPSWWYGGDGKQKRLHRNQAHP